MPYDRRVAASPHSPGSRNPPLVADIDRFSLFTEARERLGRSLVRSVSSALPECAQALERAGEGVSSAPVRRELIAAASVLVVEHDARAPRALARLYDLSFRLLELNESAVLEHAEAPLLALLGDDELDHQILVDALAGDVRERLGARYEHSQRRIDALTRATTDDGRAPLGAGVLAAAALESCRPYTATPSTRGALREAALRHFAPRLADAIDELDAWLDAQGVEPWRPPQPVPEPPSAPASVPSSAATAPGLPPAADDATPEAGAEAPHRMPPDADSRREPGAPVSAQPSDAVPAVGGATVPSPLAQPELETLSEVAASEAPMERAAEALVHATQVADVLGRQPFAVARPESAYRHAGSLPRPDALERDGVAFAHHVGVAPYTRASRQRFFEGLRARMLAAQAPAAQLAALDLVAALFDYVVDDARMPAAAQPLLWRLQQPVAALAALDAGFLGDDRRSVRRLVENLTAIAIAYADDVTQGSELYRRLDTVVRAVEVVAHAFQARSSVLGEQVRREYERAAQGVAQLVSRVAKERAALESTPGRRNRRDYSRRPSRERELQVTRRLETELRGRLDRCEVPESVRDFLLGVWLRHLRTALLRDGEDSTQFKLAIQVVDDLLWSLDTSAPRQSRRELAGRIPPLIRLLTQGVSDIGARPEEFRPFLDELFLIHLRKMQRVRRDGETEPAPPRRPDLDAPSQSAPFASGDAADARPERDAPTLQERWREPGSSEGEAPAGAGPSTRPLPLRPEAGRDPGGALGTMPAADGLGPGEAPPSTAPGPVAPAPAAARVPGPPSESDPSDPPAATPDPSGSHVPRPVPARPPVLPPDPPDAGRSGDQRLLSVLSSLDLGDFPDPAQRLRMDPDEALSRLRRGDWLELIGRDGLPQEVKVAWINSRRTVVLLVRRPDRRALSLRAAELRQRFADHKAALIV
jgi:hypothetical protein